MTKRKAHLVVSIVYDELWTLDFAMTTVFALEWSDLPFQPYRFAVASAGAGAVSAFGGVDVRGKASLKITSKADLLIIPGWCNEDAVPGPELLDAVRAAHSRGTRIAALGVGVFVLAHAGVLNGKQAATHWYLATRLARDFPEIDVVRNSLYVQDGTVYTSAGCLSGIDMLLTIIRQDYGVRVANRYARRLIAPPHRDGAQSQRAASHSLTKAKNPISRAIEWMEGHLAEKITVDALAKRVAMSTRNFARRFHDAIGMTPMEWLVLRRVRAAQELLENTDRDVEWIAATTGFGTAELLRYHFRKFVSISPLEWRRTNKAPT